MSLGLSGMFLDLEGKTGYLSTCILGLGPNIHIFFLGNPYLVRLNNCLKIHPVAVFFLLTDLALLHTLGFLKQGGSPHLTSHLGPI